MNAKNKTEDKKRVSKGEWERIFDFVCKIQEINSDVDTTIIACV